MPSLVLSEPLEMVCHKATFQVCLTNSDDDFLSQNKLLRLDAELQAASRKILETSASLKSCREYQTRIRDLQDIAE